MSDPFSDAEHPGFFNINRYVCVRLTVHGREVHKQNHHDLYDQYARLITTERVPTPIGEWPPAYRAPKEEADGWSEWQAWDLMAEFGHVLGNGRKAPFDLTIFVGSLSQLRAAQGETR